MAFEWDSLLSTGLISASDDSLFASLLATSNDLAVPSLTHSEESSPDSLGEPREPSPGVATGGLGTKRKKDGTTSASSHKDPRGISIVAHTHEEEDSPSTLNGKTPITTKRRDQNRQAQRAFRERKEKHVRDLEERVVSLETAQRERDLENDNLRDLVNQLRKENERLGAGQNRFTQSSFAFTVPTGLEQSSTPSSKVGAPPPAPISSFPAIALGGMGQQFLAELSGQLPRRTSSTSSSTTSPPSSTSTNVDTTGRSSTTSSSTSKDSDFLSLFSPGGQHLNLGQTESSATMTSPVSQDGVVNFDDYFVGTGTSTATATRSPAAALSAGAPALKQMSESMKLANPTLNEGVCPFSGTNVSEADIETLCADMKSKATCQEYARLALEAALQEDVRTMARLEESEEDPLSFK